MALYTPKKDTVHIRSVVYGYRHAEGVVEAFVMKYPRATNFVARHCGLEPKQLKYALIKQYMFQNTMWNMVRDTIKHVERHNLYDELSHLSIKDFRKYLTCVKALVIDEWLDAK